MRAHFAKEIVISTEIDKENVKMFTSTESMENNGVGSHVLPYTTSDENLNIRIAEFKSDSNNMLVVSEFIDKVLQQAEFEVNRYNNANTKGSGQVHREEDKDSVPDADTIKNENGKVANMARVFVTRMFDAIYNCANNAVSTSIPRLKQGNLSNLRSTISLQKDTNNISSSNRKKSDEQQGISNERTRRLPLHEKTKNFLLKGTTNLMKH